MSLESSNPIQANPFGTSMPGMQIGIQNNINTTNKTSTSSVQNQIHITIKSRTKWKMTTSIAGLPETIDIDGIVKKWRKLFSCSVANDDKGVIKVSGDHREDAAKYLIENGIVCESLIKIHGF